MSWLGKILGIGSIVAAPFTGGTSLAWLPAAMGVGSTVANVAGGKKEGGNSPSSYYSPAPEEQSGQIPPVQTMPTISYYNPKTKQMSPGDKPFNPLEDDDLPWTG